MRVLVTGGAGLIGSNLALHIFSRGEEVIICDSLVRRGTEKNVAWPRRNQGQAFGLIQGDIREAERLEIDSSSVDP